MKLGACDGRGFYICRDESCIERARKCKSIGRGVGRPLSKSEADEIRRVMMGQNGLDGKCNEGVICNKSSGGVAFA